MTAGVVVVVQQVEELDDFLRPHPLPHVEETSPRHAAQVQSAGCCVAKRLCCGHGSARAWTVPSRFKNRCTDRTEPVRLQFARDRQTATLQQALAAVAGGGRAFSHAQPLPHIYGSAEYLQDAQVWLQC